ncbi:MAG: ECF transporter S component [Bacteroidaceae bacterium]|nr:ECF transporter S component [Bacteroidaceae bacterium]
MEYLPQASTLTLSNARTYLFAVLFTVGNVVLPQLCHLLPQGGLIFQPLYFFTLIAACRFGWRVALLTAVASPLINSLLFAMPSGAMLPVVLIKSVVLALGVSYAMTRKVRNPQLMAIIVILGAHLLGAITEWALLSSMNTLKYCLPGAVLQVVLTACLIGSTRQNRS